MPSHEESDSDGVLEDFGSEAAVEFSPTSSNDVKLPQYRKIPIPSEEEEKLDNSIISNTPSVLSDKEYEDVCLWVGPSVVALPSNSDQRINKPPLGYIGVHYDSVKAGFTLPLHPLQAEIFNYFGIVPGQLAPNSHRFIICFILVCHSVKITPTLDLFRYMFKIYRSCREGAGYVNCSQRVDYAFLEGYPSSIKSWRGKYLFLKQFGAFPFDTNWGNTYRKHSYPASTQLLLTQADQITSCVFNVDDYSGPGKLRDLLTQLSKSHPAKSVPIGSTQVYSTTDLVRTKKQITSEKLPYGQVSSSPVVHTSKPSMSSCDADISSLGVKRKPSSYPDALSAPKKVFMSADFVQDSEGTLKTDELLRRIPPPTDMQGLEIDSSDELCRVGMQDHVKGIFRLMELQTRLAKTLKELKDSEGEIAVLASRVAEQEVQVKDLQKSKETIIKDYLASKNFKASLAFKKECDDHLDQYKASEEYKRELADYLEVYKKSEDHQKTLTQHLNAYKNSADHRKELAQHVKRFKESKQFQKLLADHLEQYKGSEEHKRGLCSYVDKYRKSEDYRKALADHLDAYKKSDDHKKLLAKNLEAYKESEEFKKVLAEHDADKAVCSFRQGISVAQVRVYDILRRLFPDFNAVSWGLPLVHEDSGGIPPPESLIKEILPSPIRSARDSPSHR